MVTGITKQFKPSHADIKPSSNHVPGKVFLQGERMKIQVGDFIEVPAWKTVGMVTGILLPHYGSENVQHILLQENPVSDRVTRYHLEPGEYTIDR